MEKASFLTWLLEPMDKTRPHDIAMLESWHARAMILAWGILLPLGVLMARYFKVMPNQNWPDELDNRTWWLSHLWLQWTGSLLSVLGVALILFHAPLSFFSSLHHIFGWVTVLLLLVQIFAGVFRGSSGGPGALASRGTVRGDHFDMTLRRRIFEYAHKILGYCGAGLWVADNQPGFLSRQRAKLDVVGDGILVGNADFCSSLSAAMAWGI